MSQITLVIMANEGAVRIDLPQMPGGEVKVVNRNVWRNLMFMPILDGEDGYGLTYGVRVAYPKPIGPHSRLSFPLTWGGTRRAGAELERTFTVRADQPHRVRRRDPAEAGIPPTTSGTGATACGRAPRR